MDHSDVLTLCHTIVSFNNHKTENFWKHCGKRRKCWWPAFSPFSPHNVFFLNRKQFSFSFTFILSSVNASNLVQSKILLCFIELSPLFTDYGSPIKARCCIPIEDCLSFIYCMQFIQISVFLYESIFQRIFFLWVSVNPLQH